MKANVVVKYGKASEAFSIIDLNIPEIGPGDVLVRVHYTSVNPLDCRIRRSAATKRQIPLTLGFDVYGEIVQKGREVADLEEGDKIIASPDPFYAGANAEYVKIKSSMCLKVEDLDPKAGAAIPLVGITAYEGLFDRLKVQKGELVLIHAGAGGVGHIAIQLAKYVGCTVITTASRPESIAFCKHVLHADFVIDYKAGKVKDSIDKITNGKGIDLIFDTVGGDTFNESLQYLNAGGHICTILPVYYDAQIGYSNLLKNITISYEFMGASASYALSPFKQREILQWLVTLIQDGRLTPHISSTFDFEELPYAHELLEAGHTTGKIIISVNPSKSE